MADLYLASVRRIIPDAGVRKLTADGVIDARGRPDRQDAGRLRWMGTHMAKYAIPTSACRCSPAWSRNSAIGRQRRLCKCIVARSF